MVTKLKKDDVIRVRVSSEQKEKFKKIAKLKNKTMSQILSVATENEIEKFEYLEVNYKKICDRAVATEEKIQSLKKNLEERRLKFKKCFFD